MAKVKIINLKSQIKKTSDDRGWMINFIQDNLLNDQEIKNIHLGIIKPGKIRGNHFHKEQAEWLFVFGGKALVAWDDGLKIEKYKINKNDYFLFEIPATITHSVKNIDNKDIYLRYC